MCRIPLSLIKTTATRGVIRFEDQISRGSISEHHRLLRVKCSDFLPVGEAELPPSPHHCVPCNCNYSLLAIPTRRAHVPCHPPHPSPNTPRPAPEQIGTVRVVNSLSESSSGNCRNKRSRHKLEVLQGHTWAAAAAGIVLAHAGKAFPEVQLPYEGSIPTPCSSLT